MAFVRMEDTHVSLIENGVPPHEQTMSLEKPFWVLFTSNMLVSVWLLGALISGFGLSTWQGVTIIVLGTLLGCIPPALLATMGPKTRLSQIEASRMALGRYGTRLSAVLNWTNSVGWDAVNNVPAAISLVALSAMVFAALPFWAALAIVCVLQMAVGVYGHHMVQVLYKYVGWLFLALIFVATAWLVLQGNFPAITSSKAPAIKDVVMAASLIMVGSIGFAPYMSDYTRYLPATTTSRQIFTRVYAGSVLSGILVEGLGFFTAYAFTDQTPQGLVSALIGMAGGFAPIALFIIILSSTTGNALNDNSAAYCFMSAGIKLPRPISAVIGALASYVVAVWGAGRFAEAFENYLLFLFYWIAPWTAILLVHWAMIGRHQTDHTYSPRWTWAATIFVVVTAVTMGLFSASPVYTSPIANALGGVDIGFYVGFIVAGFWYYAILKYQRRKA
jgi:NCS1 family nucleobase:cation symporter-1